MLLQGYEAGVALGAVKPTIALSIFMRMIHSNVQKTAQS